MGKITMIKTGDKKTAHPIKQKSKPQRRFTKAGKKNAQTTEMNGNKKRTQNNQTEHIAGGHDNVIFYIRQFFIAKAAYILRHHFTARNDEVF